MNRRWNPSVRLNLNARENEIQRSVQQSRSRKRLVIAITGATGAQLGIELLRKMQSFSEWETHLVISDGARRTIEEETHWTVKEIEALATKVYSAQDIGASLASGTFKTEGMVIIPCSMKTVAGIASGYSDNLILRAADVTIKERRPLVLVARESPFSPIHLENMLFLAKQGVFIVPPMLSFYHGAEKIDDLIQHVVGKVLDLFHLEMPGYRRWERP